MKKQELAKVTPSALSVPCEGNVFPLEKCLPKATAVELRGCRSVADAAKVGSPSLVSLKKMHGADKIHALIAAYLIELNAMLGLKRPLNETQIEFVATEIVSAYYWLTIADIHVVMRRAMGGCYGEFYESVSPPKVLGWFADYEAERTEYCVNQQITENASHSGRDSRRGQTFDEVVKSFEKRVKK